MTGQSTTTTRSAEPFDVSFFRRAMALHPSGVAIVTTVGFTATSFCSLSADPPLILVCIAKSAQCYPVFQTTNSFAVQLLHSGHIPLAERFATRGADKFATGEFAPNHSGLPVLSGAAVVLECTTHARYEEGDHVILVGQVSDVELGKDTMPAVYFQRGFHGLTSGEPDDRSTGNT